ncbi:bestrophin family protein [soil metagenome]
MMVTFKSSVFALLAWQWQRALLFFGAGALAEVLHGVFHWNRLVLPAMPLAVIGGAIGIFVSFRTNSCYARWWEGRQLWGRVVNASRQLASQVVASLPKEEATQVIRLQIAYVHVLRCSLRDQDPWADDRVLAWTDPADRAAWKGDRNLASTILHRQREILVSVANVGKLAELRLLAMDQSQAVLLDAQGGCERIKKTPFPRGYAYISDRLIIAFGVLLPFAMVKDLDWITLPINLLVCGAFALISEAGRVLEDPFTLFYNGLPLAALSTTIELNLRQRLGERDVPPLPVPNERGILM